MVEYLSGGRVQGSSTLEATATTTLDLSSASQTGTADTKFSVNTSSQQIDWEAKHDGSFDSIWWDLGASAVSDTAWVLHWTLNIDNKPEGNKWLITSLSSSVDSNGRNHRNSNSDSLCLTLTRHNDNGYSYFHIHDTDGASFGGSSNPDSGDGTATYDFPLDTDLFCELRRTSATEYIGTIRTGSHTGTVIGTITGSCASTVTGLRYLQFSNWDTTNVYDNGTFDGYIKDVKLYNNKTSYLTDEKDSLTNVPANTRYEETDTRKIYRFGGINTSGLKALYNFDSSWSNNATDSDSITTGGDMTAQNNATFSTSVKKLGTASASFPADGDYAKTSTANGANFDFTGDSTVTLWVYRTDGLDSSYHAMVSKRSGGNSEYNLYLEPVSSGVSKPHLYITMGSSTFNGASDDPIPDSTWTHLATTIDGDVMKYYINGALDSTHDLNGAKGTLASQPFGVGAISGTGTEGYQGYLDQVSVWNRALSASEISTIYNSGTGKNIAGWIERNTA